MSLPPHRIVETRAGRIAFRDSGGAGIPIVFVHANSMSSRAFGPLFDGAFGRRRRLIAIDLPGHGESDRSSHPERDYTIPGYADSVAEAIEALDLSEVILFGHSSGGHIALEASAAIEGVRGLVLLGMAPVAPPLEFDKVVNVTPRLMTAFEENPSDEAIDALFELWLGGIDSSGEYRADFRRTDPRCRPSLLSSVLRGEIADELGIVRDSPVPVALLIGENDPMLRRDYFDRLPLSSLWRRRVEPILGSEHTCYWDRPDRLIEKVEEYVKDLGV